MPIGGRALPLVGPPVSPSPGPEFPRETLEQVLDAVFYAPVGLLLSGDAPAAELASRGRRHVEAARLLGRMALGHYPTPPESQDGSTGPKSS